jgi:4-amino-4-deoxy-L-arabinose transferase-like glycosyltransferase
MSWLDALGMAGQYWLEWLSGAAVPPFSQYVYGDILALLAANRLPYAILTAVAIPALYWLARQLLPQSVALLGALFLAVDPFFLAHSRVAHGDAPLAVFMSLSALTFFIYLKRMGQSTSASFKPASLGWIIRRPSAKYLAASAVLGSLAALTKAPGQFMAIFVVGVAVIYLGLAWRNGAVPWPRLVFPWFLMVTCWGLIALAVFILAWPAMWIDPFGTIQRMLAETVTKVDEGHLVYFWGQPTLDPGPWFYPYVIPFRLTPITLIGLGLSLLLLWPSKSQNSERSAVYWFWFFTITLLLFGILSPKKQDRYLLPLSPFLDL